MKKPLNLMLHTIEAYSTDHLWYQEKDERLMIGVSEFLRLEIGDVLRVILPQAETEVDEGDGMFSIWTAEEKSLSQHLFLDL